MKAVLHVNHSAHQREHVAWMQEGFTRYGIASEVAGFDEPTPGDFVVIWGWKQRQVIDRARATGTPVLVMERGHLQPRMEFTSLGWGGLANRGRYPAPIPGRWERHWGQMMGRWGLHRGDYALVIGQVAGDAALYGVDFDGWAQTMTASLLSNDFAVRYRPHPIMLRNGRRWCPIGAELSERSLADDLADAALCVTFNSTTGVEAVLAGVPTVTCDEGAMAWDVSSHDPGELLIACRKAWARWLAGCQWNEAEIRSGEAWEAVRECMDARSQRSRVRAGALS